MSYRIIRRVKIALASEGKTSEKTSSIIGNIPLFRNVNCNNSQIEYASTWPSGNDGMWFSEPKAFFPNPLYV